MKNAYLLLALALVFFSLFATTANAGPIGPVYPAPGGNLLATSGSGIGFAGGKTFSFYGFNNSAYADLYWGPATVQNGYAGSLTQTLSSSTSSEAIFTGTTTLDSAWRGPYNLNTRTIVDLSGSTGGFVASSSIPGLNGSQGVVASVTGDFTATVQMQVYWDGSAPSGYNNPLAGWYATNVLYNDLNTNQFGTTTSFSGGFWSDPPVAETPEPATLTLLGFGIAGMAGYGWRRRKQAAVA